MQKVLSQAENILKDLDEIISRIKKFKRILTTYSEISLDKLMFILEFHDISSLKEWISAFSSDIFTLEGDKVIIRDDFLATRSMEETIDSLLKSFEEYERKGLGKKKN